MHTQACQWIGMSKRDNGQATSPLKIFRFIILVSFTFLNNFFLFPGTLNIFLYLLIVPFTFTAYNIQVIYKSFFLLNFFLQQHENEIKSNNKKKQLHESTIKITLVKIHTHRKKTYV